MSIWDIEWVKEASDDELVEAAQELYDLLNTDSYPRHTQDHYDNVLNELTERGYEIPETEENDLIIIDPDGDEVAKKLAIVDEEESISKTIGNY